MPQSLPSLQGDFKRPRKARTVASHPTLGNSTDSLHCKTAKEESEQADSLNYEVGVGSKGECSAQEITTGQPGRTERWPLGGWVSEIVTIIVSAGVAATIPVVLGIYNHRPIPQFTGAISINAVIAVLSTVAKSSLLYAISAALGQAKWDWYCHAQKSKRLNEMETFDQASRGPLGAAKVLLSRHTALSPTSVGALVVILCLLVDPFTQQVVGWAERQVLVPSEEVWTPKATVPYFCPSWYGVEPNECKSRFSDAVSAGIWVEPEVYKFDAHCPTGDCEWEPFETIEFCVDNGIVEPSTANCDISFNQTHFDQGYNIYNGTQGEASMAWSKPCDLFPGVWNYSEPERFEYWGSDWGSTFNNIGSVKAVQSSFRMDPYNLTYYNSTPVPYLFVRFPAEIITWLPNSYLTTDGLANADVNNVSDVHIPSPHW
ncbi:hypothetical protein B0H65DRAFT_59158 [Neurospora tetraspora]|uniref:Uncharacterized protein n=1 Tax=Neurospora tetraspora TaxID=94610 RepID=A0AAE0JQW4_9PEZI|nr:hypothetical protein B0H65DRAFT_59158 [Neurospora tetraspora]